MSLLSHINIYAKKASDPEYGQYIQDLDVENYAAFDVH